MPGIPDIPSRRIVRFGSLCTRVLPLTLLLALVLAASAFADGPLGEGPAVPPAAGGEALAPAEEATPVQRVEALADETGATAGQIIPPAEEIKAPVEEVKKELQDKTEELKAPVEEPKPPAEEIKAPAEEIKAPVEEAKAPVEEVKAPIEELKPPVEEVKAPIEELKPPVEEVIAPVVDAPVGEGLAGVEETIVKVISGEGEEGRQPPATGSGASEVPLPGKASETGSEGSLIPGTGLLPPGPPTAAQPAQLHEEGAIDSLSGVPLGDGSGPGDPPSIEAGSSSPGAALVRRIDELSCEFGALGSRAESCSNGATGASVRLLSGAGSGLQAPSVALAAAAVVGPPGGGGHAGPGVGGSSPVSPPPGPAPSGASGAATGGSSGLGLSTCLSLAGLLLLAAPRAMRRLRLSCRPWLTACFALIPERPG